MAIITRERRSKSPRQRLEHHVHSSLQLCSTQGLQVTVHSLHGPKVTSSVVTSGTRMEGGCHLCQRPASPICPGLTCCSVDIVTRHSYPCTALLLSADEAITTLEVTTSTHANLLPQLPLPRHTSRGSAVPLTFHRLLLLGGRWGDLVPGTGLHDAAQDVSVTWQW